MPILIVSALGDQASIRASLMAGASGFISKQAEPEQLIEAVQATLRGEQYTTPEVAAALLSTASTTVPLSDQERRAMVLYASGLKMRTVARRMGVTEGTAQEYIKRVRAKYLKAGTPVPTKTTCTGWRAARGWFPSGSTAPPSRTPPPPQTRAWPDPDGSGHTRVSADGY